MGRALTACVVCFTPIPSGTHCRVHGGRVRTPSRRTGNPYNAEWRRVRRRVLDAWLEQHRGVPLCPGWQRPAHVVDLAELEVDHVHPLEHGGARLDPANLRPLCRSCNGAKGARPE